MAGGTLFHDPPREAISRAPALAPSRRLQDLLLSILFLALLSLPVLTNVLRIETTGRDGEKRKAAPFPTAEPTWSSISSLGSRFQGYFQDNFGLRTPLIRAHALLDAEVLGVSPSPTVLFGRDGWLFYADDGGTEDIIADTRLTDEELELWKKILVDNRDWLRARGIEYVFTLAPDKHAIYPEYLPSSIRRLGAEAMMDQLAAFLQAQTDLVFVDLKTPLLEAKAHERVYDRTDTHWNRRGAYVGYRAIMSAVAARVPGVELPWARADFVPVRTIAPGQDLAVMLRLSDVLSEESLSLAPLRPRQARVVEPSNPSPNGDEAYLVTEIAGSTRPRAVVFRDSFTSRLIPYLSEHFSRTVYLWQNDLDPAEVLKEHPAVVIHQIVGRHLTSLVPYEYDAVRLAATRQ
jgi:alginate O-acetyltransferase complex protein AlgJ